MVFTSNIWFIKVGPCVGSHVSGLRPELIYYCHQTGYKDRYQMKRFEMFYGQVIL